MLQEEKEKNDLVIAELRVQIELLTEQLEYFKNKIFGKSSEKSKDVPGQLSIFNEAEAECGSTECTGEAEIPEELVSKEPADKPQRKKKRTLAEAFRGIPTEDRIIPLPDSEKTCPECGAEMVRIGTEYVRTPLLVFLLCNKHS